MNQQCSNDFSTTNVEKCARLFGGNLPVRSLLNVQMYRNELDGPDQKKNNFF